MVPKQLLNLVNGLTHLEYLVDQWLDCHGPTTLNPIPSDLKVFISYYHITSLLL